MCSSEIPGSRATRLGDMLILPSFGAEAARFLIHRLTAIRPPAGLKPLVGLSGGNTPGPVYERLGAALHPDLFQWVQIDERNVPRDDTASNQRLIRETLFRGHPEAGSFHPVPVAVQAPTAAAALYGRTLANLLSAAGTQGLDLAILGMGPDGHIASLFPGTAWEETARADSGLFRAIDVPGQGMIRYTMTLQLLRKCAEVVFLVTGPAKADVLRDLLEGDNPGRLPVGALAGGPQRTTWLLDVEAGERLFPE